MKFSLRTLIVVALCIGTLPFWYTHFLIPFFVILAVCAGMAFHSFAGGNNDKLDFS